MSNVFKNQGLLTVKLDCGMDYSQATEKKILFKKPDGTKGEWAAEADTGTVIKYIAADNSVINQVGTWYLQAYLLISGKAGYGDIVEMVITDNIKA
jgi:hypothetical protein